MKKLFRIYTEDFNREDIERIILNRVDSYTIIPAIGYWQDTKEESLIIEIIDSNECCLPIVKAIARDIKTSNKQQSVLITISDIELIEI